MLTQFIYFAHTQMSLLTVQLVNKIWIDILLLNEYVMLTILTVKFVNMECE